MDKRCRRPYRRLGDRWPAGHGFFVFHAVSFPGRTRQRALSDHDPIIARRRFIAHNLVLHGTCRSFVLRWISALCRRRAKLRRWQFDVFPRPPGRRQPLLSHPRLCSGARQYCCTVRLYSAALGHSVQPVDFRGNSQPENLVWGGVDRWSGSFYFPSRTKNMTPWRIKTSCK